MLKQRPVQQCEFNTGSTLWKKPGFNLEPKYELFLSKHQVQSCMKKSTINWKGLTIQEGCVNMGICDLGLWQWEPLFAYRSDHVYH